MRFPELKVAMAEGGIGWVAMLLDRLDNLVDRSGYGLGWDERPADVLRRSFWFCTIDDPSTIDTRHAIGVDHIMVEVDYPHGDSTWPDTQAVIEAAWGHLPAAERRGCAARTPPPCSVTRCRTACCPRTRAADPMSTLGPLVAADETLHHQITDTFATVAQSDRSWTEKVCAMAAPQDGSVQLAFGLGKYPNRGVLDAYAGVSRGTEQWTVRASRRLLPDRTAPGSAPSATRWSSRCGWCASASTPTTCSRSASAGPSRGRCRPPWSSASSTAAGTVCASTPTSSATTTSARPRAGWRSTATRYELDDDTAVSTRDHSWGVRYMVGAPVADVEEPARPPACRPP